MDVNNKNNNSWGLPSNNPPQGLTIGNSRRNPTANRREPVGTSRHPSREPFLDDTHPTMDKVAVDPLTQGFDRMMARFDSLEQRLDSKDRRVDKLEPPWDLDTDQFEEFDEADRDYQDHRYRGHGNRGFGPLNGGGVGAISTVGRTATITAGPAGSSCTNDNPASVLAGIRQQIDPINGEIKTERRIIGTPLQSPSCESEHHRKDGGPAL